MDNTIYSETYWKEYNTAGKAWQEVFNACMKLNKGKS